MASGDPLADGVILWTRVTPPVARTVEVTWEVASDPDLQRIVRSGEVTTGPERDFTVKVDVRGLDPGRAYYYRFKAQRRSSPVGRTRTAPQGPLSRLRFGVASCSSFAQGYFHAYRAIAARSDLDAVIHLGDYIYESGPGQFGTMRMHDPPRECLNLADYRTRYAQYRSDPHLQEAHRQHAFIAVWDDHESANNAWKDGAQNHQPETEGAWSDRRAAALQAYLEWMPIREQAERGRIWRTFAWGDLADLIMLDTRLWGRDASSSAIAGPTPAEDPVRTILGEDQAAWLDEQLRGSQARWKLVGQQVMVGNLVLAPGSIINLDQWHGYPASRRRFLDSLRGSAVANAVVLTGDIHCSFANELVIDPNDPAQYDPTTGSGSLGVEFTTPGITSPGLPPQYYGLLESARPYNPHARWYDLVRQGYLVLDVTPERVQSAWFLYPDITQPGGATEELAAAWSVTSGSTRLVQDAAAAPPADAPPHAP